MLGRKLLGTADVIIGSFHSWLAKHRRKVAEVACIETELKLLDGNLPGNTLTH